ncbi:MAG: tetratricopeptide repeat protein, partial [Myxococcales bacterium]|nr:tetratricopeptide repeat protein [Myxococcales bacterium]
PDARRALLGRLGALCEEQLSDLDAAVGAWKERLEDDPTDDEALVALDRLYERKGDARALVDILRSRERLAQGADARKTFMVRAAATLDEKLGDIDEAILAYRAVLDDFGPERSILASLARLYERAKRNEDLAETLVAELGLVDVVDERLDLLTRLGDVRRNLLGEVDAAIDAYREALTLSPSHAKSREAVEALLDHETARKDAADLLRPLYEADDAHEKLLRVLDIQIDGTDGVDEKLQLLALAADVAEGRLHDATRAFVYAARGTRHAAAETQLGEWLQRVERLAEKNGDFKGLCALLREVAGDILDEDRQVAVLLRVADLGRDKLDDLDLAREYYEKALELRGDDEHALLALEAIFEGKGADQDLYRILKRRGESARTDGERRTVYMKEARLLDEKLGEKVSAIEVYERILDLGLEADAIASLERLYASEGRWEDLVALHERRLSEGALSDSDKAALHHALGGLREARLGDADRAFDEYVAALTLVPQHAPTVASLEALMKEQAHAARSAEILEGVYLARHEWRKVMSTLEARLGASQDPDERRQLLRRLSKLEEEQSDDLKAALDVTARLLAEDVTDESTWAELERLARAANAERRLAEVYASELEKIASD